MRFSGKNLSLKSADSVFEDAESHLLLKPFFTYIFLSRHQLHLVLVNFCTIKMLLVLQDAAKPTNAEFSV